MVCTWGPGDRPFEEHHGAVSIAVVSAGTFQYRSAVGRELLTPGSLLLGNPGRTFECGHEHAAGDRCVAFSYAPECFERMTARAARSSAGPRFRSARLPPVRRLAPLIARVCAGLAQGGRAAWEELGVELAGQALELVGGVTTSPAAPRGAEARVSRVVRRIESRSSAPHPLGELAQEAGLSPYHFLRLFRRLTGVTPHQFLLRLRLRDAALALASGRVRVIEVALDAGFGDLSNFNRAFRSEFGVSPRIYRAT